MLAGKREVRVGDQILRGIADVLTKKVKDPRVRGITITGINLSNDLRHARIFFSVLGDQHKVAEAQSGLESAKGYIKREIGIQYKLKYVPDIVFEFDPSLEKGERMERLFNKLREEDTITV